MTWMLLVLLYGLLKGTREIVKKKALTRSTVIEVLVLYTLLSFLFVAPTAPKATGLSGRQLLLIACKSFVIFLAWICSFHAIRRLPISLYGILDLSRVLFATLLGVLVLGESMTVPQSVGLGLVCLGLLMLKGQKKSKAPRGDEDGDTAPSGGGGTTFYVAIALLSCLLNGLSGMMDKLLMREMNSDQLQFWYMLFLVLFYLLYIVFSRTRLAWGKLLRNYWVWILSLLFVIADRALFEANAAADSRVTVMTLIKQSGCVVTILGGKFIFHEQHIGYRLLCAGVVVAGIVIAVL
ncbi:MAG: EamA family transporter [Lachnospiraceae bacterium]|nr:EamA family transporter [Lachnospiraceae bacterium]